MEVFESGIFKEPTTWTFIIVSIVAYLMYFFIYELKGKVFKYTVFMLIWLGFFVLYTFGSVLTYRTLTRYADKNCDKNAYTAAKVSVLLFFLVHLCLLSWSFVDEVKKGYKFSFIIALITTGLLIAQMVLGWAYSKDECDPDLNNRYAGPFLILPMAIWIFVMGMLASMYAIWTGKELFSKLDDVGNKSLLNLRK